MGVGDALAEFIANGELMPINAMGVGIASNSSGCHANGMTWSAPACDHRYRELMQEL